MEQKWQSPYANFGKALAFVGDRLAHPEKCYNNFWRALGRLGRFLAAKPRLHLYEGFVRGVAMVARMLCVKNKHRAYAIGKTKLYRKKETESVEIRKANILYEGLCLGDPKRHVSPQRVPFPGEFPVPPELAPKEGDWSVLQPTDPKRRKYFPRTGKRIGYTISPVPGDTGVTHFDLVGIRDGDKPTHPTLRRLQQLIK